MAFEVLNSKGWTNAGVAQSAITLAQAVLLDERTIYPVSRTLYGCYGFDGDVALRVPSVIGRQGRNRHCCRPLPPTSGKPSPGFVRLRRPGAKTPFLKR
jgi:malate/lactate dehydrogenase